MWLVNTGWTGGPYGVGSAHEDRPHARDDQRGAVRARSTTSAYETDPIFNVAVPTECPGVPAEVLQPRNTWANAADYDAQAKKLAKMFVDNFKTYEASAAPEVEAAGPKV